MGDARDPLGVLEGVYPSGRVYPSGLLLGDKAYA